MKIATWNVNSIRTRQQIVKEWLEKNPTVDVLCLQETKVVDELFPKTFLEELGYQIYISGQKSYNGVALVSRFPLEDVSSGFTSLLGAEEFKEFDSQKRLITGVINGVRIINVYVPNGASLVDEKYQYKLRWLKVLQVYLEKVAEKSSQEICICGDFNIALEDKDIYDAKGKKNSIMASPLERKTLEEVLAIGLLDAFRKFTSETGYFSWWDYRRGGFQQNRGWRIDSIYLTNNLYERATNCYIDIEPRKLAQPSDHAPVIVELDRV